MIAILLYRVASDVNNYVEPDSAIDIFDIEVEDQQTFCAFDFPVAEDVQESNAATGTGSSQVINADEQTTDAASGPTKSRRILRSRCNPGGKIVGQVRVEVAPRQRIRIIWLMK
jgi:hypothetical protein